MKLHLKYFIIFLFICLSFLLISCNDSPVEPDDPDVPSDPVVSLTNIIKNVKESSVSFDYIYDDGSIVNQVLTKDNYLTIYDEYLKYNQEELSKQDWLCLYLNGYENNNQDYEYELLKNNTYAITKYNGSENNIILPSYYKNKHITKINNKVFYRNTNLKEITISDYIEEIGTECFSFSNVEHVHTSNLNKNNITYKDNVFTYCFNLIDVELGINQTTISMGMFSFDNQLETISNTNSINKIEEDAFFQCSKLNNIDFVSQVNNIGQRAFYSCNNIKSVVLSDELIELTDQVFFECKNLESVKFGKKLETLGGETFSGCIKLSNVEFPDGLILIDSNCFSGCESITTLVFPSSLESLGSAVFQNCYGVLKVTFNEGITDIGSCCFINCKNMVELNLSSTITHFGLDCFVGCKALKEVVLPDNMRDVYDSSFSGCSSLEKINIPEKVILIGGSAFNGCNLKEVVIPKLCVNIMNNAFKGNNNLEKITINYIGNRSNDTTIFKDIFGGSVPASLKEVVISDICTEIKENSFNNCSKVKTLTIGSSVSLIGKNALTGLTSLENIYFNGTTEELNKIDIDSTNKSITDKIICLK